MTTVSYRDPEFIENPVIPLVQYLHEFRDEESHNHGMRAFETEFPQINNSGKVVMITDEEKAIVNAVKKFFPNVTRYRCVLHAWQDIKHKIRNLIGSSNRILENEIKADFSDLIRCDTKLEYKTLLASKFVKWEKVPVRFLYTSHLFNLS